MSSIIRQMSSGQDLSSLFSDVLKLMSVKDLKLKKLIYIFITQNAQQSKQLALLTVNALQMDVADQDTPIIRAQAIRAMGSVATEEIADYFITPITNGLHDSDPYVRKCAVTCIGQLYAAKPQTVIDHDLITELRKAIFDSNQAVVSAAATTLVTIAQQVKQDDLQTILKAASLDTLFTAEEVNQILIVVSNATEWAGLNLLNAISRYGSIAQGEDFVIALQRLQPFLRQQNPAVVLCTINIIIRYLKQLQNLDAQYIQMYYDCVSSIISIISGNNTPEIQFVALRSLRLIAKAFPASNPFSQIQKHIRIFFARFNDPVYIKLEKVEVLSIVTQEESQYEVIKELSEQCEDVQPDYVRACIRCIGQLACRLPSAADVCVDTYMKLLTGYTQQEKNELTEEQRNNQFRFIIPSYAAQELLIAVQQIFRSYPNRYEGIIGELCESISNYDNTRAKAALIWILGEYCQRIDDVQLIICDLLDIDIDNLDESITKLQEETIEVQLAILTAVCRIYVSSYTATQNKQLKDLFEKTIESLKQSPSQDVRTRCFFLENLVKLDETLQVAFSVMFVGKPTPVFSDGLSDKVSEQLSNQLGSVSATLREIVQIKQQTDEDIDQVVQKFDVAPDTNQLEQNIRLRKAQLEEEQQQQQQQQQEQEQKQEEAQQEQQPEQEAQKQEEKQEVQQEEKKEQKQPEEKKEEIDIFADIFGISQVTNMDQIKVPTLNQQPQQQEVKQEKQPEQQPQPQPEQPEQIEQQPQEDQDLLFFENLPVRLRDPTTPLKIEANMSKKKDQIVLSLKLTNLNQFAISGAILSIHQNVFSLQPVNPQLPVIPAMGVANSGKYFDIPLMISGLQCNFPADFMQIDDNGSKNMNKLTFDISYGDIKYMFQLKVPYQLCFKNSGIYHQNGQLVNQFQASLDFNSTFATLKSKSMRFDVQYNAATLHQKLLKQGCQYIGQIGDDQAYCIRNVVTLIKVSYQSQGQHTYGTIETRNKDDEYIVGCYTLNAIASQL